ncbi:MAG: hypothetical protein U1E30_04700 [Rhodoblastus sp.]
MFKPSLRWDAALNVFEEALSPLKDQGVAYDVSVGAHGAHGSVAGDGSGDGDREQPMHGALRPLRDAPRGEVRLVYPARLRPRNHDRWASR